MARASSPVVGPTSQARPKVAFFDSCDVFEDFYPHYGIDQPTFARTWAGTGNHAFIRQLQREVGDVTWYELTLRPDLREAQHEVAGCRVRFVRSSWLHRYLWRAFYLPRSAWRWRGLYPWYALCASYLAPLSTDLLRALRRDRPDVLVTQDYASGKFDVLLAIAASLNIPLVARHSGSCPEGYVGKVLRRWTIRRADLMIASGAAERALLVERFRVPIERAMVILTPTDITAFRPIPRREACTAVGLDAGRRYLLFVGRLSDHEKRISSLIEAFATLANHHRDTDLLVVGAGRDGATLRALAQARVPGRVRFLGWTSGADRLAPLYSAAVCLVLPSNREGFPSVVGEAMSCGTPVVASWVGGVPELVTDGRTGWLVRPGDDRALVERLGHVLTHAAETEGMRSEARRSAVRQLSPAVISLQLREGLERVLARRG